MISRLLHFRLLCTHTPSLFPHPPGKWVVTPDYVLDSIKKGSWLAEAPYEVSISTSTTSAFYPVRQWREKVASGRITGAFQGWRVLLMIQEPTRRDMFKRYRARQPPTSHPFVNIMLQIMSLNYVTFFLPKAPNGRQGQSLPQPSVPPCSCHSCHG